ncbi:MAG: hypothetical protein JO352_10295 [Chloroflexi bacterium]|nr:hypothetical protein [Chloroflexota bacterium]
MDATPQPTWPPAAPQPSARPASPNRAPAAATIVAVALAGVLVGFGGAQALGHTPSLASSLAQVSSMMNGGAGAPAVSGNPSAASAPAAASSNPANPANPNPNPARTRAPGANRAPAGNQAAPAGDQAAAGQPASSQDQAAIQQAIQSIDDAQAKAVSANDLSGLTAGATSDFANQQKSVTQDLLDNGVSNIKLDNIEWGAITLNGSTATATAYETWTTTYSDSTTDQSRDRNVYTLVQQDGNWVVQADDHPDAEAAFPGGLQSIPSNLLPPGFPNPFQNQAPQGQPGQQGTGNTNPSVQVQP